MSKLKEMVLVQGEIIFKVSIDALVEKAIEEDEGLLIEFMINKALSEYDLSDEDFEYIDSVDVLLSEETANKYKNQCIMDDVIWKEIIAESRKNKE